MPRWVLSTLSETGPLGGNVTGPEELTLLCFLGRITAMETQGGVINRGAAGLKNKTKKLGRISPVQDLSCT